jgi:hypothetical protein
MFTKYNNWLARTAADPALRRVAIADLTKRRAVLFRCAAIVNLCRRSVFYDNA